MTEDRGTTIPLVPDSGVLPDLHAGPATHSSPARPRVPPELFRPILQFIHPNDFDYNLCLISRAFRIDVEAQFYKYVAVPERGLLFFCETMSIRPDLALRVHRLAFTGSLHREPEPEDNDTIARMLRQLVNLKDLSISQSRYLRPTGKSEWPAGCEDVHILHGCSFRLERLDCFFLWAEPFARWLGTQPQLTAFEHSGSPRGQVHFAPDNAPLMNCGYLRISSFLLTSYHDRPKPQPTAMRLDLHFAVPQEEFDAARAMREMSQNLKCFTLTRHTNHEEYMSTSRILRTIAEKTPDLTSLAIYESIDYSAGENKRILNVIKEHLKKLQVFVWAPLNYPVIQEEDDYSSSSSGFSIESCTEDEIYSYDKTERYALAMFDAVPSLRMFISFRKGPCHVWRRGPIPRDPKELRPFKRTALSIALSEDTFRSVDPENPLMLLARNVPHGPPVAEARILQLYNAPIVPPISRSAKSPGYQTW
ncbi:hypothetical protein BC834DRAFT_891045 [Gloeopeniophorella convolvens]|nr:hypothetical protein BC834DRAFT_891045 [Gloeopeniophorella convolvens]